MGRVFSALLLCAAAALAKDIEISSFHADVKVLEDGVVDVTETLEVRFRGSWNGIYRDIPYRFRYRNGVEGDIRISIEAVDGDVEWHKVSRQGGQVRVKIKVLRASNATRNVTIRYRCRNVVRNYGDDDELYWNVTGSWPYRIAKATAKVMLPASVPADEVRMTAFTGEYGSKSGSFEIEGLEFRTTQRLGRHEQFTIVVGFPTGHVEFPSWLTRVGWFLADNWPFAIPLLLLLAWAVAWYFLGRDRLRNLTVVPEFEAPFDLGAAEVGALADEVVHDRDVTASIVELAVRGLLRIEWDDEERDYRLHPAKNWREDPSLRPFEKEIMKTLFPGTDPVWLEDRQSRFPTALERIREKIHAGLVRQGLFAERVDVVRNRWNVATGLAVVFLCVIGFFFTGTVLYWVLSAFCVWGMILFAHNMPRRTRKGLDGLRRVRGMEEYIATAERERMKDLPADAFEKMLPFAIALKLHRKWRRAFRGLYENPTWFTGDDNFHGRIGSFVHRSDKTVSYQPRTSSSSSGSGWSGSSGFSGGFSGGGFGGGGGGGW